MQPDIVTEFPLDSWGNPPERPEEGYESLLEAGKVLFFPRLEFTLNELEKQFLDPSWSDGKSKNISYRGADTPLQGASGSDADIKALTEMVARFSQGAETLVHNLFPHYRGHLRKGFTSYRTAHVATRVTSWRKDDTRLHVDSFPSNPTGGLRLLRVFTQHQPQRLTPHMANRRTLQGPRNPLCSKSKQDVARPSVAHGETASHQSQTHRV
jgi:hypothetical protein